MFDAILNDTALLVSLIATVVVGVAGIIAGYRFRSERVPRYVYDLATVQTKAHPEVSISYRGEKIDNLHSLQFAFWNSGRTEMRQADLPSVGGPRIVLPDGGRVLSLESKASDPATEARVAISENQPNEILVSFRYLNHHDAICADLLYTLPAGAANNFSVTGSIIGARRLKGRKWDTEASSRASLIPAALAVGLLIGGILRARLSSAADAGSVMIPLGAVLTFSGGLLLWQYVRVRAPQWVREQFPASRHGLFLTSRYITGS